MPDFSTTDPYHRFFLRCHYQWVDIVHADYKVVRPTPAGAWIIEDIPGAFRERWVGHTGKAFAYQDVHDAWFSFKCRMRHRVIHARNELEAVEAALVEIDKVTEGPTDFTRVIDPPLKGFDLTFD